MKTLRKNAAVRSLKNAAALGLAVAVLLSLVLMFAGAIGEMPRGTQAEDATAIVSAATAAVPAAEMRAANTPLDVGADSRLDEFRLDPDSCCISYY
jgi:hypothetical protein